MEKSRFDELMDNGTMEQVRAAVEEIVKSQNEFLHAKKYEESRALDEQADELVNRYTNLARTAVFKEILESEDPMKAAVLKLVYQSIRIKETEDKDSKIVTREVADVDKDIDLIALHKKAKNGIGADPLWIHYLQELNYRLAVQAGQALRDPKWTDPDKLKQVSDCFIMSDIARQFKLGKNPVSNTQLLKTLGKIINAMIGDEYKPTSHQVAYLKLAYAKAGRAAKEVQLPNHRTFCRLMRDICNECMTQTGFVANSRAVKNK